MEKGNFCLSKEDVEKILEERDDEELSAISIVSGGDEWTLVPLDVFNSVTTLRGQGKDVRLVSPELKEDERIFFSVLSYLFKPLNGD